MFSPQSSCPGHFRRCPYVRPSPPTATEGLEPTVMSPRPPAQAQPGSQPAALLLYEPHGLHGQHQVGDAAPQPAQLVRIHAVEGVGRVRVGEPGPEKISHFFFCFPRADTGL